MIDESPELVKTLNLEADFNFEWKSLKNENDISKIF